MKSNTPKLKYKLVFLGDQHVGKTALINRFINNTYDQTYNATIGIDFLVKNIAYQERHYRLQLWDTAGQERFKSLIPSYLKDSSCALILYDVTNVSSLENAFRWFELYNQYKNAKAISFLVGNKVDLAEGQATSQILKQKLKNYRLKHYLVSAKQGTGVDTAFQNIVTQLDSHHKSILLNNQAEQADKQERQIKTAQALLKETDIKFHLQKRSGEDGGQGKKNCCV